MATPPKKPPLKKTERKKTEGASPSARAESQPWQCADDANWIPWANDDNCDIETMLEHFDERAGQVKRYEQLAAEGREELARQQACIERAMETLKQLAAQATKEWDASLRRVLKDVRLEDGFGSQKKKTGAKPWSQLAKQGATDAEILTNLRHVKVSYAHDALFEVRQRKKDWQIVTCGPGVVVPQVVVESTRETLGEIRRVFAIKQGTGDSGLGTGKKKPARTVGGKPVKSREPTAEKTQGASVQAAVKKPK